MNKEEIIMSVSKINDENLDKVSGGIMDEEILSSTFGQEILCPTCHKGDMVYNSKTRSWAKDSNDPYCCERCHVTFTTPYKP